MAICIVIHASHTLIPNLKESKLWKELVKEMAWLTTILQWRGFLRLFRQNFQFLFRICSLPSCTWTDHLSDKIESGHKVGTIPQRQDKSKHTFRNGDILYVSINNFYSKLSTALLSISFELRLSNIGYMDESKDILTGRFACGLFMSLQ